MTELVLTAFPALCAFDALLLGVPAPEDGDVRRDDEPPGTA